MPVTEMQGVWKQVQLVSLITNMERYKTKEVSGQENRTNTA
jgi:hypothetical protein